jgi:hypothetical protein
MKKSSITLTLICQAILSIGWNIPQAQAAIISNGTIQLGVNAEGHLNVPGGIPSSETGTNFVGLRLLSRNSEGLATGCLCEGWGIADRSGGISGYANEDEGGVFGLTLESFTSTSDRAISQVTIDDILRVTYDYRPARETPYLYEIDITIENLSSSARNLVYRRVMDWDVDPTTFNEFVTIQGTGAASNVLFASDDGFSSANPLSSPSSILFFGDAIDVGPRDLGSIFDISLGSFQARERKLFKAFYGVAPTESDALAALVAVDANVYSFGQPNVVDGPFLGTPNTFIFAFNPQIVPPIPEGSNRFSLFGLLILFLGLKIQSSSAIACAVAKHISLIFKIFVFFPRP